MKRQPAEYDLSGEKADAEKALSRIKLLVSYDGTEYAGWQRQSETSADERPTLQGTLEEALSKIFSEPMRAQSSGRTDAGVHADGQIVHFDIPSDLSGRPKRNPATINEGCRLLRSLNALTPPSMSIKKAWLAPRDFHALHSATQKTYRYVIHNDNTPDAIAGRFSYWHERPLDLLRLNGLTECLIGEHDFKSFQTSGTELKTTVRQIISAVWSEERSDPRGQRYSSPEGKTVTLHLTGTGFLKQMVRNIVGTTIYLHHNGFGPDKMQAILKSCDRQEAKATAPSEGLFLESVYYPADLDNRCLEL